MNFDNLHQILRSLYEQMMPLCGDMAGAEQDLGAAELAVVVVAHGGAVGTGVVDVDQVDDVDPGQHPVNGELVIVLAQAADHIVLVVAGV